jgi:hypothetical protein
VDLRQGAFPVVIFQLAFSHSEPPAVIVDNDIDMIRIVEGHRCAIERGVIERPLRRSNLPNEPRKFVPVFFVAGPATFCGKIKLVPPFELSFWRQWLLTGFLVAD